MKKEDDVDIAEAAEVDEMLSQEEVLETKLATIVDKKKREIEVVKFKPEKPEMTFQEKVKALDNATKIASRGLNMIDKFLKIKKQLFK